MVGPPGIVLIGEGNPNRLAPLLASERRKHERVRRETTIPRSSSATARARSRCRKLVRHVTKLPKTLKPAEMTDVLDRLKALDANRSTIPLPKGPMPTSHEGLRAPDQRGR